MFETNFLTFNHLSSILISSYFIENMFDWTKEVQHIEVVTYIYIDITRYYDIKFSIFFIFYVY